LLREVALSTNPYVKIGGDVPVVNLRPRGWLADVVEKVGGDEAIEKFPEVRAFLDRLRERLQMSSPASRGLPASSLERPHPILVHRPQSLSA
jgi:hypothetical protein